MNPTKVNGILYPTQRAAAASIGVHENTLYLYLANGENPDMIGKKRGRFAGTPQTYKGKTFPTQLALCNFLGITVNQFQYRSRNNLPLLKETA